MGSDRQPSDTFEDVDEDLTYQEFPTPSYDRAPPTIEERLSPFHSSAMDRAEVETVPGRAPRVPTMPGMPVIAREGFAAPVIRGAPEVAGSDGPTNPDGVPAMSASHVLTPPAMEDFDEGSWDQSTDPDGDADPRWSPGRPHVPSPDAPSIQISKSMEIQVAHLEEGYEAPPDPRVPPVVAAASPRHRAAQAPTEVMLPALKRKKKKREGSDWPLIFGLLALVLLILGLAAVVILGVMGHLGA